MAGITLTPNLKLSEMPANFHVWAQLMNNNLIAIDAAISGFIVFNNLRGAWTNSTAYAVGDTVVDPLTAVIWQCQVANTSSVIPTTFAQARVLFPTFWTVYSAPAKARGAWVGPGTSYALNDFVVSGSQYAVCIAAHVSSGTFAADLALSRWSVLVDLSSAGSLVLPILGGAPDANKLVITNPAGNAYQVAAMSAALLAGGASSLGISLLTAASQAAARTAIGEGSVSTFNVGVGAQNIPQLDGSSRLPAVDGSQLTNLPGSQSITVYLASDQALGGAGAFIDVANTGAIGAAGQTWLIMSDARIGNVSGSNCNTELAIFNGTSYIVADDAVIFNLEAKILTAWAIAVLTGPTTFTARVKNITAIAGLTLYTTGQATGVANKASYITAVRLS